MASAVGTLCVADNVATVTPNRPPANAALRHRLVEVFDAINDRDDVHVAVLTGQGRMFHAGADLKDRHDPGRPGAFRRHDRITRELARTEDSREARAALAGRRPPVFKER